MRALTAASLTLCAAGAGSCGTSPSALYEGDSRFEHCMALDHGDTKPQFRRACWDEWVRYYSFGQTRDRIDYATRRANLDPAREPPAAPGPTNMASSPPVVASAPSAQASAPPPSPASASVQPVAPRAPGQACLETCQADWQACAVACGDAASCGKACSGRFRTCARRCL